MVTVGSIVTVGFAIGVGSVLLVYCLCVVIHHSRKFCFSYEPNGHTAAAHGHYLAVQKIRTKIL
jgi:hypothetical protein